MENDARLEQSHAARDQYASSLGDVDPDVLAPIVNPSLMGGPEWPDLRQAWRVIRRARNTIIMSDGLADPFSDDAEPNAGFELQVLVETGDAMPDPLYDSWLFVLAYEVSQQCADHGGIRGLIDKLGLISLELPSSDILQPMATANGTAGVLLGIPPPDFATEFSVSGRSVRVVTAKLLWPSELKYAVSKRETGRKELPKRFAADGSYHRSSLLRKPVV